MKIQQDQLEPIEPLNVGGIPLEVEAADPAGFSDDLGESEQPPAPAVGGSVGYPISEMFGVLNRLASKRLFPSNPLNDEEIAELVDATRPIEDHYAPDISGPWFMWARWSAVMGAIYVPRVMEEKKRREQPRDSFASFSSPTPNEKQPNATLDPPDVLGDEGWEPEVQHGG